MVLERETNPGEKNNHRTIEIKKRLKLIFGIEWKAKNLEKEQRTKVLREHPALVARLFHLKQKCLWDFLILGKSKPIGHVVDYWRRVEVRMLIFKYKWLIGKSKIHKNHYSFRCEGHHMCTALFA